ncbi:dephospho-CoA kinase [Lactobacillus corticis]|uniref:Dephospho-CoA kinase n=1 Tax=Lactobacillus corticis TaxID=2201249 RepID=A0A916QG51_9LACO|nr:dephospho-CoA kinase [Lactobacillus corticis]GFZ26666.1 dephospho-CoA kinase [Lactobacillus corticis]
MTFILGLTGGIATGKSVADQYFKAQKLPVVDSDQIAHRLMEPGQSSWQAILAHFGSAYLNPDQTINRKKLGHLVFSNPQALAKLNELTHPLILAEIRSELAAYRAAGKKIVIYDAPLMLETGSQRLCDKVLVISLPHQLQIERLMARDGLSQGQAEARIASQMPLAEKVAKADYVIENTGTIKDLERKLAQLLEDLESEA